jgi:hypothetical protein
MGENYYEFHTILIKYGYRMFVNSDQSQESDKVYYYETYNSSYPMRLVTRDNHVCVLSTGYQHINDPTVDCLLYIMRYGNINIDMVSLLCLDVASWNYCLSPSIQKIDRIISL